MEKNKIAKWLFLYFFIITTILGFSLILLGRSLLHIDDVNGLVAVILPTFVGQLTLMVKWLVDTSVSDNNITLINISSFLVKGPPIIFAALILVTFIIRIAGYHYDANWTPDDSQVKATFTFLISIFNATTVYLTSVYFSKK